MHATPKLDLERPSNRPARRLSLALTTHGHSPGLGAPIRNVQQHHGGPLAHEHLVYDKVPLPLQLQHVALLERSHVGVAVRQRFHLAVFVYDVRKVVVLLHLFLGDQVVEVRQSQRHQLVSVRQPRQLQLRGLDGTFQMQLSVNSDDCSSGVAVDRPDHTIPPVHQRHLLALDDCRGIHRLQPDAGHPCRRLDSSWRVFLVSGHGNHLGRGRPVGQCHQHSP
mmetsp:Transcript_30147/g.75528  ORF Transcript_30147/g.75528 Transcript_30147/m.75528 type:complete len:222 (-) Transcript_30147:127-792(-)